MGSIDPAKILVVLLVALIVLGPEKLPQMGRQIGKLWADFRRVREELETEVRGAFGTEDGTSPLTEMRDTISGTVRDTFSTGVSSSPGSSNGDGSPTARPADPPQDRTQIATEPARPSEHPVPPGDPSMN